MNGTGFGIKRHILYSHQLMFSIYLKSAWRNLLKHKFFSFISVAGLAIGLCACMLIIQYVNTELGVDRFHKNLDNLYRVVNDRYQQGSRVQHSTMTYSGIGKAMKQEIPEVEAYCRVSHTGSRLFHGRIKK